MTRRPELLFETCLAFAVFSVLLAALIVTQGCGSAHGPQAQVGAYGVWYPAASTPQDRAWLDEVLVKDVELVGAHLGPLPLAIWPRAGHVYWHADSYSLAAAKAKLGRTPEYDGWAGWIDGATLHVVASVKGTPLPDGALGHLLEHWHRGDYQHADPRWPRWDSDYAAWDQAFWWAR